MKQFTLDLKKGTQRPVVHLDTFREYFEGIANAKSDFIKATSKDKFDYIASVSAFDK